MQIATTTPELREAVRAWRAAGLAIGFVPTMGALHAGHLALVRRALDLAPRCVVSIFVNPTQFGPGEDLARYPRTPEADRALLTRGGCHLLYCPTAAALYPPGHSTFVEPGEPARGLEGDRRPGHFRGVATVVCQLLNLVQPDLAVFGEKDAQQLAVVRRMARDLHLPVEIVAHPTVRDPDGLALSSRNRYLSADERQAALVLPRALAAARELAAAGERSAARLEAAARRVLEAEPRFIVEYVAVVSQHTFRPVERVAEDALVAAAGRVGSTRLIDNVSVAGRKG